MRRQSCPPGLLVEVGEGEAEDPAERLGVEQHEAGGGPDAERVLVGERVAA